MASPTRRAMLSVALTAGLLLLAPGLSEAKRRISDTSLLGRAQRAYEAGDYSGARRAARRANPRHIANADYLYYIRGQSEFALGLHAQARRSFRALAKTGGSRFGGVVPWRIADCEWELGNRQKARAAYERLVARPGVRGERIVARYRIAQANLARKKTRLARTQLRALLVEHPLHPLAPQIRAALASLGAVAPLSSAERIRRARKLSKAHKWHEAIAEFRRVGVTGSAKLDRERDYWMAMTLFNMRRRYGDAGQILTRIYKKMGDRATTALFHGARGLSRADRDVEAINWYQRLVREYPHSKRAAEAQFLSGWLEFNMGNYAEAIPHLARTRRRYSSSRWAKEALWFEGFAHYLLGHNKAALPLFVALGKKSGRLYGGKGNYWAARARELIGDTDASTAAYRTLVGRFPFSWYAMLARARLAARSITIGVFGDQPGSSSAGTAIAASIDTAAGRKIAKDPLMRRANELIAAGLTVEAGDELRRGEKPFLKRHKKRRADAIAVLLDGYRRAGNFNRPWYLGIVYGRRALRVPPKGQARIWWQYAYPRAYQAFIDKWRSLGGSPPFYLLSIMRKESGFNPHDLSYADAYGLLQMIPATTRRVAKALGLEYTSDLLYSPELNIRTGSWYIGRLLQKFAGQIPIGSGSFNSGPRPWMRWIDQNGARPMDEFIELVPYRQTREYAKKVTETFARYQYLYAGITYEQSLVVDRNYVVDELTY